MLCLLVLGMEPTAVYKRVKPSTEWAMAPDLENVYVPVYLEQDAINQPLFVFATGLTTIIAF